MRHVAVLLIFLTVAVCGGVLPRKPAPQAFSGFSAREQEVYLALFHHMFARWQNNKFHFPSRFYLTLRGFDAPDDLLKRFKAEGYAVAPGYRYREGTGILCSAENIRFNSASKVTVWGGYVYGSLGSEAGPFVLAKRHGS